MLRRAVLLLLALAVAPASASDYEVDVDGIAADGYDFGDPAGPHTKQAIAYDSMGQTELSLRAFLAAARFNQGSESKANLAVCLMRMQKYFDAYDTMKAGFKLVRSDREREHLEENWAALMQSMEAMKVEIPSRDPHDQIYAGVGDYTIRAFAPGALPESDAGESDDRGGAGVVPGEGTPAKKKRRKKKKSTEGARPATHSPWPYREKLAHQRSVVLGEPMPRVSVEEMDGDDPQFEPYRQRLVPFILTGGLEGWKALEEWPDTWQTYLPSLFPNSVTDFYPYNMLSNNRHSPYLTRLPRAVRELLIEPGPRQQAYGSKFKYDGSEPLPGRYMHLQLTGADWARLERYGDIKEPEDRHWHLSSDHWMEACLGYPDSDLADEYHIKTHWKIILAGARGAGMFNHSDSLLTASWHAHLMGEKWWYVCGYLLDGSQQCYEDYLVPGETLYYGKHWYHETQNIVTPTMTITDTVAHADNFESIADQLHATCARNKHTFDFSANLCDALQTCYEYWHEVYEGKPLPEGKWAHWRSVAGEAQVAKREKTEPHHNNYDGRNYITE